MWTNSSCHAGCCSNIQVPTPHSLPGGVRCTACNAAHVPPLQMTLVLPRLGCSAPCRLAGLCSQGQPVADAAGVLQVQLHSFSPLTFPAAPQTPPRLGVAQTPAASTDASAAGGTTAAAALAVGCGRDCVALLKQPGTYEQVSVVAVLADGVPVPATTPGQDTTLVSRRAAAVAATASWVSLLLACFTCKWANRLASFIGMRLARDANDCCHQYKSTQ